MNDLEMRYRRPIAPNVQTVSSKVFYRFVLCLKAGVRLGVMLFMAFTTFTVLSHSAGWIKRAVKEDRPGRIMQVCNPAVIPGVVYRMPVPIARPVMVFEKRRDDYRVFREENRLMTGLMWRMSRTVSRMAR